MLCLCIQYCTDFIAAKPEGVSEGTTSTVEFARGHHSNDKDNTEEQTYGLFCSSFTFTQIVPYIGLS
jgi:hypothetical protein